MLIPGPEARRSPDQGKSGSGRAQTFSAAFCRRQEAASPPRVRIPDSIWGAEEEKGTGGPESESRVAVPAWLRARAHARWCLVLGFVLLQQCGPQRGLTSSVR